MDDLATKWVLMTVFVFTAGAVVALVWSIMAGQWKGMHEAAMVPLEDGDDLDDDGRLPDDFDSTQAARHTPAGS